MKKRFFLLLSAGFFSLIPMHSYAESLVPKENRTQAHAEVLTELYQVVLLKMPKDRSAFGNWVDSLNQGASIEGVYNGFTHSKEYRDLEKQDSHRASPEAVQVFVDQWFYFQKELTRKTELTAQDALPLRELSVSDLIGLKKPAVNAPQPGSALLSQENAVKKAFSKASVFTLKRVLGDQALLWISEGISEGQKSTFPLRYANWVLAGLRSHVDFGLTLRNRDDAAFHAQWAARELKSKRGLLEWEVLNRIHRLLNAAQAAKKPSEKRSVT